ncbi:MAG: hypothetical protein ACOC12_02745, partial [Bacteroidota bacterium]
LYTVPQAPCESNQANRPDVAAMLNNRLEQDFPGKTDFRHVEFLEAEWLADRNAQQLLEQGEVNLPFVLVDGETATSGDKVNIARIADIVREKISH